MFGQSHQEVNSQDAVVAPARGGAIPAAAHVCASAERPASNYLRQCMLIRRALDALQIWIIEHCLLTTACLTSASTDATRLVLGICEISSSKYKSLLAATMAATLQQHTYSCAICCFCTMHAAPSGASMTKRTHRRQRSTPVSFSNDAAWPKRSIWLLLHHCSGCGRHTTAMLQPHPPPRASLRVASCRISTSTLPGGSCAK